MLVAAPAFADEVKAAPAKTTIVLVHGAFAEGSAWDKVVPLLTAKGYEVVAVHEPLTSFNDDVGSVKRAIQAAPGDVVLVGHSYGGVLITEAGNDPKVKSLVYIAALAPDGNQSANDLLKEGPPAEWLKELKVTDGFGALSPVGIAQHFAQDVPAAQQKAIAIKQGWTAMVVFDGKPKAAAWKTKPSWYIVAKNDKMIPAAAEEAMAKKINAKVTTLATSHVPMVSKPSDVATVILAAAAAKPADAPAKK